MSDGSINIDTKIDTGGFNDGMKQVDSSANDSLTALKDELFGTSTAVEEVGSSSAVAFEGMGTGAAIVSGAVAAIGITLAVVLVAVIAVVAAFVILTAITVAITIGVVKLAMGIWDFSKNLISQMVGAMNSTTAYGKEVQHVKDLFDSVQQAIYAAFSPIIAFAIPYIEAAVHWLIVMLNTVAMIIAALFHQNKVMQYVEGSTKGATTAAKGALAAFDQLNVLSQAGGGANAGAGQFVSVEVDPDILKKTWAKIVQWLKDEWTIFTNWLKKEWGIICDWFWSTDFGKWLIQAWEDIKTSATDAWAWIVSVWSAVASWFQLNVIDPLVVFFAAAWTWIAQAATDTWNWIAGVWGIVWGWYKAHVVDPMLDTWRQLWATFSAVVSNWWLLLTLLWGAIGAFFLTYVIDPLTTVWLNFAIMMTNLWQTIWTTVTLLWGLFSSWFQVNVIDQLCAGLALWWTFAVGVWTGVWNALVSIGVDAVNTAIGIVELMLNGIISAIDSVITAANNAAAALHIPGWTIIPVIGKVRIPRLTPPSEVAAVTRGYTTGAAGLVIPPNAPFAALLGDQASGVNVEAPEALIRQIVREEVQGAGGGGPTTINFAGNLGALVRVLKPYVDRENTRVGKSLISGGVTG